MAAAREQEGRRGDVGTAGEKVEKEIARKSRQALVFEFCWSRIFRVLKFKFDQIKLLFI